MFPENDVIRLRHMLEAAEEAVGFIEGRSRADLDTNHMLSRAVVRDIEIVGEAASRVSSDAQDRTPSVPWQGVIGMRNRLVHGYFEIDLDRVWDTLVDDLPPLISELREILGMNA